MLFTRKWTYLGYTNTSVSEFNPVGSNRRVGSWEVVVRFYVSGSKRKIEVECVNPFAKKGVYRNADIADWLSGHYRDDALVKNPVKVAA